MLVVPVFQLARVVVAIKARPVVAEVSTRLTNSPCNFLPIRPSEVHLTDVDYKVVIKVEANPCLIKAPQPWAPEAQHS